MCGPLRRFQLMIRYIDDIGALFLNNDFISLTLKQTFFYCFF